MQKMKKTFAMVVLFVCGAASLTACETQMMGAGDGDCHINSDYEIRCDGDDGEPGLQTP